MKPTWMEKRDADHKSLTNELKQLNEPKKCSLCPRTFKPINRFQRFCSTCRAKGKTT